MKECHPDRSNAEAHELCVLINEVYETLSDPQKRAAYDAISGLAEDSVNPFTDATHERDQVSACVLAVRGGVQGGWASSSQTDAAHQGTCARRCPAPAQVFVDEVTCIGCRNCANVCPSSFKIEDFHGAPLAARAGGREVSRVCGAHPPTARPQARCCRLPTIACLRTGRARVTRQNADTPEKLQEAIDTCPVSCIHW